MDVGLPEFSNPPVVEVVLAVQFEPLEALRTPQVGLLWNAFRDRFPRIEEHPALEPEFERFGVTIPPAGVRLEMRQAPPVPRCWFLNDNETELIQVQKDRFVHNWRKHGTGEQYPRYDHVRKTFKENLATFEEFLSRENVGSLSPNQCEVAYINHMLLEGEGKNHGDPSQILTLFDVQYTEQFLPELEEARVSGSYVIPDGEGPPLGRLRFSIGPAYRRSDHKPMCVLNLTARGRPQGEGVDGVFRFFDLGREWIVRGFAAITTPEMHRAWRRRI